MNMEHVFLEATALMIVIMTLIQIEIRIIFGLLIGVLYLACVGVVILLDKVIV